MNQGQVITLQPGTGDHANNPTERSDWSPSAQTPDPTTGIIAHTPDPTGYHDAGGRTMVPRSTRLGASRGFVTKPGIVNIDADPVTGVGAFQVDMATITKESMDAAMHNSGGNPLLAYSMASGNQAPATPQMAMPTEQPRVAPAGENGYVVPKATVGGSQTLPAQAALGSGSSSLPTFGQVENPSVKKPEGPAMSQIPMTVPRGSPPPNVPATAAVPHPHAPTQPAPVAPAPPTQPWAQVSSPVPDPTLPAILQTLGAMNEQLARMNQPNPVAPPEHFAPDPEQLAVERDRAELARFREVAKTAPTEADVLDDDDEEAQLAVPTDVELPFLTTVPSRPTVQVAFDLGPGGTHLKRFHDVTSSNRWLSLIFDTRYEGDQFTPPTTPPDGEPITLNFPQYKNRKVRAIVPEDCHLRIGCMDIINFLIIDDQPEVKEMAGFNPSDVMGPIPHG